MTMHFRYSIIQDVTLINSHWIFQLLYNIEEDVKSSVNNGQIDIIKCIIRFPSLHPNILISH